MARKKYGMHKASGISGAGKVSLPKKSHHMGGGGKKGTVPQKPFKSQFLERMKGLEGEPRRGMMATSREAGASTGSTRRRDKRLEGKPL